jgi:hypothetical protein
VLTTDLKDDILEAQAEGLKQDFTALFSGMNVVCVCVCAILILQIDIAVSTGDDNDDDQ